MIRRRGVYGLLITVLLVLSAWLLFLTRPTITPQLKTGDLLTALWQNYKQQHWQPTGQSFNDKASGVTTSEGQSYTMLRALFSDDRQTFNKTWDWTRGNLMRQDRLFSWHWGKLGNGYGVMVGEGGQNAASDADTDIALSLVLAGVKWHDKDYLTQAQNIIRSIWDHEVIVVNDKPYLASDNLEKSKNDPSFLVNPSYFAPYAYRIFSKLDSSHDWKGLASNSYDILQQSAKANLDTNKSAGLPPNWVMVDRKNGQIRASKETSKDTDFGFDAFRAVWRTALDWQWFQETEAKETLSQFSFLNQEWEHSHKLLAIYNHDGQPKVNYASVAVYGGTLSYFQFIHPPNAKDIVSSQFSPLYDFRTKQLHQPLNYYDNNWAWFGLALYDNSLPNLVADKDMLL
jgi:endoglucanase